MLRVTIEDDLHLTLLILARFSLMPDLLDFFNYDAGKLLHFIDRFGGMTIEIPAREDVAKIARNMHIYRELRKERSATTVEHLSRMYGITSERVRLLFDEVVIEMRRLADASGLNDSVLLETYELRGHRSVGQGRFDGLGINPDQSPEDGAGSGIDESAGHDDDAGTASSSVDPGLSESG